MRPVGPGAEHLEDDQGLGTFAASAGRCDLRRAEAAGVLRSRRRSAPAAPARAARARAGDERGRAPSETSEVREVGASAMRTPRPARVDAAALGALLRERATDPTWWTTSSRRCSARSRRRREGPARDWSAVRARAVLRRRSPERRGGVEPHQGGPDVVPLFDTRTPLAPLREEIDAKVGEVIDGGSFILGPEVAAFEAELADYLGARHAIGVANGTDAITLAAARARPRAGDEVVVPLLHLLRLRRGDRQRGRAARVLRRRPGDAPA